VVATLSLVGIGAATGLAAGETRQQDALKTGGQKAAAADTSAAPTSKPRAKVKGTKRPRISTSRKTRTARATETREDGSSTPRTTKPKPRATSTKPKPTSTKTTAPDVVAPPAVPSTGS
jgi:hypothetical protein